MKLLASAHMSEKIIFWKKPNKKEIGKMKLEVQIIEKEIIDYGNARIFKI